MLAAALFVLGSQDIHRPRTDPPGGQIETILSIDLVRGSRFNSGSETSYQELGRTSFSAATSVQRVGLFAWQLEPNATWNGKPCKKFVGDCTWKYKKTVPNTAIMRYRSVRLDVVGYVDPEGRLVRWESEVVDSEEYVSEARTRVTADLDHDRGYITTQVFRNYEPSPPIDTFPNRLSMQAFSNFFEPMLKGGLIRRTNRRCAMIHPLKGTLYEFDLKITGRFSGNYFLMPQEGYTVESIGRHGYATSFISRQGQLLAVECPNGFDASLQLGYIHAERKNWGRFSIADWDKSPGETNPGRPVFKTMVTPVLVGPPDLLVPYPVTLAL